MSPSPRGVVLVTGASGFVGRALVVALAADGWRVRAAARDPAKIAVAPGIEMAVLPDLASSLDWPPLLEDVTHGVHLAGIAHTGGMADVSYMRINGDAAGELARAVRASGIGRFVLMSSVRAQVGASATQVLTEDTPPAPSDAYGRSKLAAEQAVARELGGVACCLRPVLIVGDGVKGNLATLRRLALTRLPLPLGALHNKRSLLSMGNLVSIVKFALTSDSAKGAIFLAADPEPMSVADLLTTMRGAIGRKPSLIPVPPRLLGMALALAGKRALSQSLLGDLVVSTARLRAAGWQPVLPPVFDIARMMRGHD